MKLPLKPAEIMSALPENKICTRESRKREGAKDRKEGSYKEGGKCISSTPENAFM